MSPAPLWIEPQWPAPANVRAAASTRVGGVSAAPWNSLNLGAGVGDAPAAVAENRRRLREALALPGEPAWLRQVHGTGVLVLEQDGQEATGDDAPERPAAAGAGATDAAAAASGPAAAVPAADAAVSRTAGRVCVVTTADCLPLLLCDVDGACVGAVHAGWRGLAAGVIERAIAAMGVPASRLMAWLGPAIGAAAYEVDAAVRDPMLAADAGAGEAFTATRPGHWHASLARLAHRRLAAAGVGAVHGGDLCTHADPVRFFSYRRDGRCGRMATLIWLDR